MQAVLNRGIETVVPFKCVFADAMPTQPEPPNRPPPDLPLELWHEIFQFATYVHRSASIKPLNPFGFQQTSRNVMGANTPALAMQTKLVLVQVCKPWRRLTLPLLYEHIVVRSPPRAQMVLQTLRTTAPGQVSQPTGYGQWTRQIEVLTHARGAGSLSYLQSVFAILQLCPNLRILSGVWTHTIPAEFLSAISRLYGPSLEGLSWSEISDPYHGNKLLTPAATYELLSSFTALRVLDFRHIEQGARNGLSELSVAEPPFVEPIMPQVEHLIISSHPHSLNIAARLSLPKLRHLTMKTPIPDRIDQHQLLKFVRAHGRNLESVDLPAPSPDLELEPDSSVRRAAKHINPDIFLNPETCPVLHSISFAVTAPVPQIEAHPALQRLGLRGVRADLMYPDRTSVVRNHLYAITAKRYPSLEIVQTVGFLVEADVDSLIKDVFIWWVEKFEKLGIDLLDGEGVLWAYETGDVAGDTAGIDQMKRANHSDVRTSEESDRGARQLDTARREGHGSIISDFIFDLRSSLPHFPL